MQAQQLYLEDNLQLETTSAPVSKPPRVDRVKSIMELNKLTHRIGIVLEKINDLARKK
jgi:hypothetical protein